MLGAGLAVFQKESSFNHRKKENSFSEDILVCLPLRHYQREKLKMVM
jgi:hypothetical protein